MPSILVIGEFWKWFRYARGPAEYPVQPLNPFKGFQMAVLVPARRDEFAVMSSSARYSITSSGRSSNVTVQKIMVPPF